MYRSGFPLLESLPPVCLWQKLNYDALNWLSTVMFLDGVGNPLTSTYAYDNVGNLQGVTHPNGVVHAYTVSIARRFE